MLYKLNSELCTKCDACKDMCCCDCIKEDENGNYYIDTKDCVECDACFEACEFGCIEPIEFKEV